MLHILVLVSVVIVLTPVAGMGVLRIYDTELIRQTEAELIGQAAFTDAAFRHALLDAFAHRGADPESYGHIAQVYTTPRVSDDGTKIFRPEGLELDVRNSEQIRPPWDDQEVFPDVPPHPAAVEAGERVQTQIREAMQVTLFGMRLVDPNGVVIATSVDELGLDISHREEVRRALAGESVHLLRRKSSNDGPSGLDTLSRSTEVRVFFAMPILLERRVIGAVVFSRTPVSLEKALYRNSDTFWGLAALVLGLALVIALLTSVAIVRPVRALVRQVRAVGGESDTFEAIDRPFTREFAELSTSVANMATRLNERAHYIRHFARSVSHEFKTPLTSMRGTVELLEDHFDSMPAEKRTRFLAMLNADVTRLSALVDRLHELAAADVVKPSGESADAVSVARLVVARFEGVTLETDCETLPVPMASEVLDTVLSNLLSNAAKYGAPPVVVRITEAAITVSDAGPGISPGNRDKIFDEFFTTGRNDGGTGLGLSIVRALVESHGGQITLLERPGTAFELRF